jgi:uncharacterized NAD-dependent epimerase/dehydratase family protein
MIEKPYLIFLGEARDELAAKTAHGVADWRPEWCVGQLRLPNCKADAGLPDVTLEEAARRGAKTFVIGATVAGGQLPAAWSELIVRAMELGMDVANVLHDRLESFPAVAEAAKRLGRKLHNVRHSTVRFDVGKGLPRPGKRLLTVGSDCSIGKKYTALAIEREMRRRGLKADFRATGQTGVLISERGVAIDAVVADFISGAAEWLTPANEPDHWDVVEGQGSLFHPSFAGVTLGLLHGAAPHALVLCHEPTRTHMRGLPHYPLPSLEDCLDSYVRLGRLTNPECRFVGISVNTERLEESAAARLLRELEERHGLPCVDPIRLGVGPIVDRLP